MSLAGGVTARSLTADRRRMGLWLAVWAAMVMLTVVIGGITRLTESGLSITEWKPVSGVLPPLSAAEWNQAFVKYQQVPEYQVINRGMTRAQFQRIYLVEYVHRLWARLVGVAFAVPLVVFLARRSVGRVLGARLVGVLALTGLQGAMGWYMVQSGLTQRTDVSQYRLAAHLALALVIYGVAVWTAADLLASATPSGGGRANPLGDARAARLIRFRRRVTAWTALVFLAAIAGAFVAGLDAGRAYNTFPLMGGRIVPQGYLALHPWWRNLFEQVPAVQFNHRVLGVLVVIGAVWLWAWGRGLEVSGRARRMLDGMVLMALVQVSLGIATLLLAVPIPLAALHQSGAVVLFTFGLLAAHALWQESRSVVEAGNGQEADGVELVTGAVPR